MTEQLLKHIFFVDDEPKVREVICDTLEQLDVKVSCFASGTECLAQMQSIRCDLLITDLRMPGMDGLELMKNAKNIIPWLPVLVITGYGDIPLAVKTVKSGAADFIEKPLEKDSFLNKVKSILEKYSFAGKYLLRPLTKSESQIFRHVIEGKSNREIAELLHRSVRTIEVHRSRIMKKFGVDNMVELVKRATIMGLLEISDDEKQQNKNKNENKND
jgi:two-component system response regulator FixJ